LRNINKLFCNMFFFKKIFKNRYARLALIAIFFCLIVISRRADAITYPQFYAEDGVFWYSEAYNAKNFWEPFLIPKQGYFQTISRIGGTLGNLVDISYAPIVFNFIAIFLEVLPAIYFLSSRFSKLIPKFYVRFFCGLAYLLLLGTAETHANLTNAQWRLALLMFLIIIAPESKKIGWKIFDNFFLLLAGLSGPFVFFALPTAIVYYFYRKLFRVFYDRLAILGLTFLIQFYSYLFITVSGAAVRTNHELGASVTNFFKILSGNIFIRSILCRDYTKKITHLNLWDSGYLPILIGILGAAVLGYVLWKARIELKLLILFTFLAFFAALVSPQTSLTMPQWEYLAGGSGGRYYFLPKLAWIISLGWLLFNSKLKFLKIIASVSFFCFIFLGLFRDWAFDEFHNYHYEKQAAEFKNINAGEMYEFKIVPGWKMSLIKK
jgi:hypothetical protein